jgi:hypothetical protein
MSLRLDHPAITMSTVPPYDILQLTAMPRNAFGDVMTGLPAPTYRSTDTTKVLVTANGLLRAVGQASQIQVIAELVHGPVRHADTAIINVDALADPPELGSISINPFLQDSFVWPMPSLRDSNASTDYFQIGQLIGENFVFNRALEARVVDVDQMTIPGVPIEYTSLDRAIATIRRRVVGSEGASMQLIRPGQARMVARTTAYGITATDTVVITVTLPTVVDARP